MPSLPPHLLKPRIPSTFEVPTPDIKATKKQIDAYEKLMENLPEDSKKKLKKLQKEHGLTRDQLILAALNEWAPQYAGAFKMAEFFGIVRV